MIEWWQQQLDAGISITDQPLQFLADYDFFHPLVQGRAWLIEAQRQLQFEQPAAALAACDAALPLLQDDIRARTPVLQWRIAAMERLGHSSRQIDRWLHQLQDEASLTLLAQRQVQTVIGRPMPELRSQDVIQQQQVDLATWQGEVIVVYFFATWAESCDETSRIIAQYAQRPDAHRMVAVSLDTNDTAPGIPAYANKYGWQLPVLTQAQGWGWRLGPRLVCEATAAGSGD